jgi:hypothetical protein
MPTQTAKPFDPLFTELYDALMAQIEPELTSVMLPRLDELYADETPEEKAARGDRYKKAFALFEERFGSLVATWRGELQTLKRSAVLGQIERATSEDAQRLGDIDSAITQA